MLRVDNMEARVPGRESAHGVAEPGRYLLETDVFHGGESVRAKKRCDALRIETADRTFAHFFELLVPLSF